MFLLVVYPHAAHSLALPWDVVAMQLYQLVFDTETFENPELALPLSSCCSVRAIPHGAF